jgi:uncharacterized protein YqjF (DUF2071 family)
MQNSLTLQQIKMEKYCRANHFLQQCLPRQRLSSTIAQLDAKAHATRRTARPRLAIAATVRLPSPGRAPKRTRSCSGSAAATAVESTSFDAHRVARLGTTGENGQRDDWRMRIPMSSRPGALGFDVTTRLVDFAIVTFAVDPRRLAALLPSGFEAEVVTLSDGSQRSLISAVPFRDDDFRMTCLPWVRLAFNQINYRAYVRYRGDRVVWFFGTMLASPLVAIPRYVWRLPWHAAHISLAAQWSDGNCTDYALEARGAWGTASLRCAGTTQAMGCLDGFADSEQTSLILTHPLRGYYHRRDGKLGSYAIWHERLNMSSAVAQTARFSVFENLGLTTRQDVVHSVLLQRESEFIIKLPPRAVC